MTGAVARGVCLALSAALVMTPEDAHAQGARNALYGLGVGAVAGTVVALGATTAASLAEVYLWDTRDVLGWPALPIVAGVVTGTLQGSSDADRLERAWEHAAVGGLLGAAGGALLGEVLIDDGRGPWAGGLVGAGAGVLAGWIVGSLTGDDGGVALTASIPLEFGR